MLVTIVGVGMGCRAMMTQECVQAIEQAEVLIGAQRLIEGIPLNPTAPRYAATKPEAICELLREHPCQRACVLMSGDIGFYSGARGLLEKLEGCQVKTVCGLSSAQVLAGRLHLPWQGWHLVSAHGVDCNPAQLVASHEETFFLTGGRWTSPAILAALCEEGLGQTWVAVGERLGYPEERVTTGTAQELCGRSFAPLSAVLCRRASQPLWPYENPGIPDDWFERGDVPMTKREVRVCALAQLGVRRGDVVWDIGAGTGSVSVELALLASDGEVWAVERNEEACALIARNRVRFGAYGVHLAPGEAPEVLDALPTPDAVFVGGSGGRMDEILACAVQRNPSVRLCITAIALESAVSALEALQGLGCREITCTQVAASRARAAGQLHLMLAQNPVFVISAEGPGDANA